MRSAAIREPCRTSTHAPPPPAPQQNVPSPFRGISTGPPSVVRRAARGACGLLVVAGEVARVVKGDRLGRVRARRETARVHQLREELGV